MQKKNPPYPNPRSVDEVLEFAACISLPGNFEVVQAHHFFETMQAQGWRTLVGSPVRRWKSMYARWLVGAMHQEDKWSLEETGFPRFTPSHYQQIPFAPKYRIPGPGKLRAVN